MKMMAKSKFGIEITLGFPEAKNRADVQRLCRLFLQEGRNGAMMDVEVGEWKLLDFDKPRGERIV